MSNISVVFSFDENYVMPTLVAALSLLDSSLKEGKGGRYSLFFLTEKALAPSVMNEYEKYLVSYSNCSFVKFVVANGTQKDAFESRHLTRATYLRLEIPELIDLDKVIYSDIDVLFLSGLESLWDVCVDDVYLAATLDVGLNQKDKFNRRRIQFDYWQEYYNDRLGSYYQAGILLMNLKLMRETEIVKTWRRLSREKFNYHDMDIINITCYPKIRKLSSRYNVIPGFFVENSYEKGANEGFLDGLEVREVHERPVMVHYAGEAKPWKHPSVPGSCEYWEFLRKFPDLEEKMKKLHPWSFCDKIRHFFCKPLFDR